MRFFKKKKEPAVSFHVAVYAANGAFTGITPRDVADLSPKWIAVCRELLDTGGAAFDSAVERGLPHVRVKLTSTGQSGMALFTARDRLVASAAFLGGQDLARDAEVLAAFLASMREAPQAAGKSKSFSWRRELDTRPLVVMVAWGLTPDAQGDDEAVREFCSHFAAAFFADAAAVVPAGKRRPRAPHEA